MKIHDSKEEIYYDTFCFQLKSKENKEIIEMNITTE